jgi:hypothetical protein
LRGCHGASSASLTISIRRNNRIEIVDQYLRIVILRYGFGGLRFLVFWSSSAKSAKAVARKTNDDFRSTKLALQASHSDWMVVWCWLRISRISRRNRGLQNAVDARRLAAAA